MSLNRRGFTLIEVLIVVVILGILAAIIIPRLGVTTTEAREYVLRMNLASLRSQVHSYHFRFQGQYPSSLTEFQSAVGNIPRNPYTNAVGVQFITDLTEVVADEKKLASGQKVGWFYHPQSGGVWANCEGASSNGRSLISF